MRFLFVDSFCLMLLLKLFCFVIHATAQHPILYFDEWDIAVLQNKAKTTHAKIANKIKEIGTKFKNSPDVYLPPESFEKFGSKWNEIYGNNLCAFAMYCVLYPDDEEAMNLVLTFMDRMTSYPDWYVSITRNKDEVPIGHSLTGYVTAFDFLYQRFSEKSRRKYLNKIKIEAEHMYSVIIKGRMGWTKQHIHNHAPTNVVATLLAALVYEAHFPQLALTWKKACVELLEKSMLLLSYVIDGSSDEGVGYGSYSSRGFTQYVFLALRHLNIDHTKNPWLREHFWFFYATVLPGYQRSVGIADSNYNWFFGPESQLVFLDAFVLKNGYGNWLADHIRTAKPVEKPLAQSSSHVWSTIHTEFIFYDPTIKPVQPVLPTNNSLHIFSDWGVVTYGGGQEELKEGNTFLSFKSGALNGEVVSDIVNYKLLSNFIKGWENFNPGHEHPDQNSFVFAPNGRYFITEELYAFKQTFSNNVLAFAPIDSECNYPWEGQAGECSKWLKYTMLSPVARGKIFAAVETDGYVFMAGDSVHAYRSELGLESVQRSMVLLHPEVLLVLDTVILKPESKLTRASAFFNNLLHPFESCDYSGFTGAKVTHPEGPYSFFSFQPVETEKAAFQIKNEKELNEKISNFVNVTFSLNKSEKTRIAYLFVGPNVRISKARFLQSSNAYIARLQVILNEETYSISISSLTAPVEKRVNYLGFAGFAQIQAKRKVTYLGIDQKKPNSGRTLNGLGTSLVSTINEIKLKLEGDVGSTCLTFTNTDFALFGLFSLLCFTFVFKEKCRKLVKFKIQFIFAGVLLFGFSILVISIWNCKNNKFLLLKALPKTKIETNMVLPPTVIIVSLPNSGSELLEMVFENSTDFLYLTSDDLVLPEANDNPLSYDPCWWPDENFYPARAGWFASISAEPLLFLNNQVSKSRMKIVQRMFRERYKGSRFVLNLNSGFWTTKLSWLQNSVGPCFQSIAVVRDPRAWIYSLLREDHDQEWLSKKTKNLINQFTSDKTCSSPAILPKEFKNLSKKNLVERLAQIWSASVANMINEGQQMHIVRFEDLRDYPQFASTSILQKIGATISLPEINHLTRFVKSGHFSLPYEPNDKFSDFLAEDWKNKLSSDQLTIIMRVCRKLMNVLGYS